MRRRTFLRAAASSTVAGAAGCLSSPAGGSDTYLSDPDRKWDPEDLPFPAYGQTLPAVTLTDPVADREVTTTEFDRDVMMTFFYSHCMSICPVLIRALERIQEHAASDGHGDDVVFLAVTFDPQRDDGDRLRAYADERGVDLAAGNWHFLRPSPDRVKTVVQETFGVSFKRTDGSDGGTTTGTGDETATTGSTATGTPTVAEAETTSPGSAETTTGGVTPAATGNYMFAHQGLILLANRDDYVERAYLGTAPSWQNIYEDFERLREREGSEG
ncbi:MAG: protein SCO1/2 [Halobacteriales archaeon]|jgi:protein SCO1/2